MVSRAFANIATVLQRDSAWPRFNHLRHNKTFHLIQSFQRDFCLSGGFWAVVNMLGALLKITVLTIHCDFPLEYANIFSRKNHVMNDVCDLMNNGGD